MYVINSKMLVRPRIIIKYIFDLLLILRVLIIIKKVIKKYNTMYLSKAQYHFSFSNNIIIGAISDNIWNSLRILICPSRCFVISSPSSSLNLPFKD